MCALYPPTDDLVGIEQTDVDAFLERFKRETTPMMWAGVVLGSVVFAATPPLTVRVPLPAFLLRSETRDRHAAAIAGHPVYLVRQSVFLVKLAAGLCWGRHAEVREKFSLDPYGDDPATWRQR
jgi:hypothetical protein